MSTPLYQIELMEYTKGRDYASIRLVKTPTGWSSEWVVSRNFGDYIQVQGLFYIPIFGEELQDAERRCRLMADEVLDFASWAAGGEAGVPINGDEYRRAHCRNHLFAHRNNLGEGHQTITERTAILYRLALQFNINNPAALIAGVEGLPSVRTVHDRLAHARRIGFLESPGKGKTQ